MNHVASPHFRLNSQPGCFSRVFNQNDKLGAALFPSSLRAGLIGRLPVLLQEKMHAGYLDLSATAPVVTGSARCTSVCLRTDRQISASELVYCSPDATNAPKNGDFG